ncbi:Uncharacterised protein [Vibrio cholerae]|nr:Uncharacterised protein [Vibrio cholerae]
MLERKKLAAEPIKWISPSTNCCSAIVCLSARFSSRVRLWRSCNEYAV